MDGDGSFFKANEFLWRENARLVRENQQLREELARREDVSLQLGQLEARAQQLAEQNKALRLQLKELSSSRGAVSEPARPVFKANVRRAGSGKSPGRKAGHAAEVRPRPASVDVHQNVPLGVDGFGKPCCPECRAQLDKLQDHERLVEDLIPLRTVTTCYHTQSGWCPSCRRRRESRAPEQPPASDLAQAQLGINALVMASILRVNYRLPMRQVARLYGQLPGLKVCAGTIARQLQRVGQSVERPYQQLQQSLRLSKVIHADETGWRTDGVNTQLWTITDPKRTLYHIDRSRGGKVIAGLLGKHYNADGTRTLVSDFYTAYDQFDGPQQKCFAHLLRELKETAQKKPALEDHPFLQRCSRLIKQMLTLKANKKDYSEEDYQRWVEQLEKRLEQLGRPPPADADPDIRRLTRRIAKYRGKLTTFLHRPEVDATNNAAERALRPAVVMRKITGGSRSAAGARAWAVLASVLRTCEQQGKDVVNTLRSMLMAQWAGQTENFLD